MISKNKVLHLTSKHTRYDGRIYKKEAVSLANNHFDVSLIVYDKFEDEVKEGVKILSLGVLPTKFLQRFRKIRKSLKVFLRNNEFHIVHLHDPELLLHVRFLKKLGIIVIYDSHEDTQMQILDKKYILNIQVIISYLFLVFQQYVFRIPNVIITVTPHILKKFKRINNNSYLITNYPILIESYLPLKNNKKNVICFVGGVSKQWNHELVLDAIKDIDDITYKIAGEGSKEYLAKLQSHPSWDKVEYYGKIPFEQLQDIYNDSILGLAMNYSSQSKNEGSLGITKFFEYLNFSIPVICTNYNVWIDIIDEYNCGIYTDVNDVDALNSAIKELIYNKDLAKQLGNNGRKIVENKYNWKSQEENLIKIYKALGGIQQ